MIFDRFSEHATYESLHPLYKEAFEFLKTASDLAPGRYELSGGMYAKVSAEAMSKPFDQVSFEAHKDFIDLQYIVSGTSVVTWAPTDTLTPVTDYDPVKDIVKLKGEGTNVAIHGGEFFIVYPNDGHRPHCTEGEPVPYRVIVVKVPVLK